MMRRDDEGNCWNEYLVYSTTADFFWLVETQDGWARAQVMHEWPMPASPDASQVMCDKARFGREYGYTARVDYAAGAFNWRVAIGDTVQVAEFAQGQTRLAAESTAEELTWSRSTPVAFDQVCTWFAIKKTGASTAPAFPFSDGAASTRGIANKFMLAILMLNIVPVLLNFSGSITWVLLGLAAIFLPSLYIDSGNTKR
jgi:hypothetical protein